MAITPQTELEANHPDTIRRELAWIRDVSPLWQHGPSEVIDRLLGALSPPDASLADEVALEWAWHGAPRRLGRRFESLFTALLERSPGLQVLTQGLPIREAQQTIGELDYVLELDGQVIHLEVAVKFYAGLESEEARASLKGWVGPSCQDRFDIKVRHLETHQLPLVEQPLAKAQLQALGVPEPTVSIGLIFGYLLTPWNKTRMLPEGVEAGLPSFWCTHRDAPAAFKYVSKAYGTSAGWAFLPRAAWIAPYCGPVTLPQSPKSVPVPEQADCYALSRKDGEGGELLRLFVMPNSFTERALETYAGHLGGSI